MKIVVCVKHVPDAQGERRFEDGRVVRGEDDVLNDLDEYAIEEAVSLVEKHGGEVVAVTMGPEDSEEACLRALQMGANRGLHVCDDDLQGIDVVGTAKVLAAAIRFVEAGDPDGGPVDLVFTGMASLDGMTSMLPAALATELRLPLLGNASQVTVQADAGTSRVTIERAVDGWQESLTAPIPAVVSVTDQINEPRYPSFKTMRAARQKPLDQVDLDGLAEFLPVSRDQLASSIRVAEAAEKARKESTQVVQDTGNGGELLADYLLANAN